YGPEHPALWKPHRNLGSALLLAGDLPAARRHLERAIELVGASLGPSHAATGPLQYALAASYADSDSDSESDRKKDLDHAFKLATIALQTHIREVPDNNPRRVQPVILMGLLHTDRDEPAEALPYREEVLRRLRHAGPEDRADAHYNIAVTLHELHRSEEALDHIRLASALVSEFSTPSAELVEDIEAYKAEILRSLGRTQ
ncbi:MAG TPA: tetratricopeptide repeat protein, partial [Nannocystis sp.]